ncbi:MAG TPA: hypothetical protein VFW78_01895 [Bacteroidia bacterium]|nr:hypothetical protein [Bacteroidia bacterium]
MTSDTGTAGIFASRLRIITDIIGAYNGEIPLHRFLKSYFSKHRNFGSSDRRLYAAFVHGYFRIGRALPSHDLNIRLAAAAFLAIENESSFKTFLLENFLGAASLQLQQTTPAQRLQWIADKFTDFDVKDMVPAGGALDDGLTHEQRALQLLELPPVWIRIREGHISQVVEECKRKNIEIKFDERDGHALGFRAGTSLTEWESFKKGAFEIQDLSSQMAGDHIPASGGEEWWDCCCGAGGKSLQLLDKYPVIKITATDIRTSVLENFRERLQRNRLFAEKVFSLDVNQPVTGDFAGRKFDGIIADVPCSGSGTWNRTPEQLVFFDPLQLRSFQERQTGILENVWPLLKSGGTLVYITCSIYMAENEDVIEKFCNSTHAVQVSMQSVSGAGRAADTLFVATLKKP